MSENRMNQDLEKESDSSEDGSNGKEKLEEEQMTNFVAPSLPRHFYLDPRGPRPWSEFNRRQNPNYSSPQRQIRHVVRSPMQQQMTTDDWKPIKSGKYVNVNRPGFLPLGDSSEESESSDNTPGRYSDSSNSSAAAALSFLPGPGSGKPYSPYPPYTGVFPTDTPSPTVDLPELQQNLNFYRELEYLNSRTTQGQGQGQGGHEDSSSVGPIWEVIGYKSSTAAASDSNIPFQRRRVVSESNADNSGSYQEDTTRRVYLEEGGRSPMNSPRRTTKINIGSPLEISGEPGSKLTCLEFSPYRTWPKVLIASGSLNKLVQIWDVHDMTLVGSKIAHDSVSDICWSKDGTELYMATRSKELKYWNLDADKFVHIGSHQESISSVDFIDGPDFDLIATTSFDKTIRLWDYRCKAPVSSFQFREPCLYADVYYPYMAVAGSPKSTYVLDISLRGKLETPMLISYSRLGTRIASIALFRDPNRGLNPPNYYSQHGIYTSSPLGHIGVEHMPANNYEDYSIMNRNLDMCPIPTITKIRRHPILSEVFATAGLDGCFRFWNRELKGEVPGQKVYSPDRYPMTCMDIHFTGNHIGYGVRKPGDEDDSIFIHSCYDGDGEETGQRIDSVPIDKGYEEIMFHLG